MPTDPSKLARAIIDLATDPEAPDDETEARESGKDPAAVALGRKGGRKGGKARAEKMTSEERSEAASKAARVRWKKAVRRDED